MKERSHFVHLSHLTSLQCAHSIKPKQRVGQWILFVPWVLPLRLHTGLYAALEEACRYHSVALKMLLDFLFRHKNLTIESMKDNAGTDFAFSSNYANIMLSLNIRSLSRNLNMIGSLTSETKPTHLEDQSSLNTAGIKTWFSKVTYQDLVSMLCIHTEPKWQRMAP